MRILSLDISRKSTGYAILENNKLLDYGIVDLHLAKKKALIGETLSLFSYALSKIINKYEPEFICIEAALSNNIKGFETLAYFHGIVHRLAYTSGVGKLEVEKVYPATVRKFFKIKVSKKVFKDTYCSFLSNASKTYQKTIYKEFIKISVISFINRRFNLSLDLKDNDIADAILVGLYFQETLK